MRSQVNQAADGESTADDSDMEQDELAEDHDDEMDLGDIVLENDADDDKAPRYGGVQRYVWSPVANELIFISGGDLYRYDVEADTINRLTRTNAVERNVQYLPDGSGYTYLQGSALMRVTFGTSLIEQIDPRLPNGVSMGSYRISPDGQNLALQTTKGGSVFKFIPPGEHHQLPATIRPGHAGATNGFG